MENIPNPGSKQAIKQGCSCPVLDNNYGKGFSYPNVEGPAFYISENCPLHENKQISDTSNNN